jgi:threonine synthase
MHYVDTRARAPDATFGEVALSGTAPGGGLWMPSQYPQVELEMVCRWDYASRATHVIYPFVEGTMSFEDLDAMTHAVYTPENFGTPEITPIEWLEEGLGLLQLSNGPTLAFKDLAMMLVARLIDHILERQDKRIAVVVSTSGDTGGAAVKAFRGLKRVELYALYPKGRVSQMQQLMMTTAGDLNVHAIAVDGTFDDCQAMTKALFDDRLFAEQFGLSAVNSINWARVIAQVVYWVSCAAQALNRGATSVMASVPSGNFGDAFSAEVARRMGVPISTIIVATNQNDVLYRFWQTGIYEKREVLPSSSPSMDIQVSSNFERLLFELTGREGELVADWMDELAKSGKFNGRVVTPALTFGWEAGCASEAEVLDTIRSTYHKYGRVIDPHTAVAMKVGLEYRKSNTPLVIAETAKPAKFPDTIRQALRFEPEVPLAWRHLQALQEHIHETGTNPEDVKEYIRTSF